MRLTQPPPTTLSFKKSATPLSLTVKPSKLYLTAVWGFHLLALAATGAAALPLVIKCCIVTAVIISFGYNLLQASKTRYLIWHAGNRWTIGIHESELEHATLTAVDFLSQWLVIITVTSEQGRAMRIVIPFDSVLKDSYRLLRVRLRIEGHQLINPTDQSQPG